MGRELLSRSYDVLQESPLSTCLWDEGHSKPFKKRPKPLENELNGELPSKGCPVLPGYRQNGLVALVTHVTNVTSATSPNRFPTSALYGKTNRDA